MFEELAYMTWRLRSPRISICKLEAQESQWCNSAKGLRTGGIPVLEKNMRWDVPVQQQGREKRGGFLIPPLFILFRPSVDWVMPTHIGESQSALLSLPIQMLISQGNTLTETLKRDL